MVFGGTRSGVLALALALGLASLPSMASAGENFDIVTGDESSASYAVGIGISSLVKVKLRPTHKVDMSPLKSDGVVDMVRILQNDDAQFAIVTSTVCHFARTGTGMFTGEEPDGSVRAVATLWREAQHIVIDRNYMQTGTVTDLGLMTGEPVSIGVSGSGSVEANKMLMGQLGIDLDDGFDLADLNNLQSAQALSQGRISAMSTPAPAPAAHIRNVLAASGDRYGLLSLDDDQVASADGGLGLWTPYIIPASTYPGQDQDLQTVAKSSLLVVRGDVDDEVVYQVTKTMFEHLEFLRNSHDSMSQTALEDALIGMPIALHPGALRYYQEVGLLGEGDDIEVALADNVRLTEAAAYSPSGALEGATPTRNAPQTNAPTAELPRAEAPAVPAVEEAPEPETETDASVSARTTVPSTAPFADFSVDARTFVIHFGQDEEAVNGIGLQQLNQVRVYADSLTSAEIVIDGHSSVAGDPAENAYLAEARTQSVIDVLQRTLRRDGHEIVIEPGDGAAPAANDGKPDLPRNRRVEITVRPLGSADNARSIIVPGEDDEQPFWRARASLQ